MPVSWRFIGHTIMVEENLVRIDFAVGVDTYGSVMVTPFAWRDGSWKDSVELAIATALDPSTTVYAPRRRDR